MAKKSERTTKVILIKLAILLPAFYAVFYVLDGIMVGSFQLTEDGTLPFDWISFSPAIVGRPLGVFVLLCLFPSHIFHLAAFLAMAISYFVTGFVVFGVVRAFSYAWDYSVTISLSHFVITCLGASNVGPPLPPPDFLCVS